MTSIRKGILSSAVQVYKACIQNRQVHTILRVPQRLFRGCQYLLCEFSNGADNTSKTRRHFVHPHVAFPQVAERTPQMPFAIIRTPDNWDSNYRNKSYPTLPQKNVLHVISCGRDLSPVVEPVFQVFRSTVSLKLLSYQRNF